MKLFYSILAGTMLFGAASFAQPDVRVSVDFFHDSLDSYGDWREVGDYGYCWQPREVDANWRPYSDGRWLYTDAGWTWDSEEPYSWAVYHYGRWARLDRVGWVWVPGTEWAPAWVSWRGNRSHIGWAPLPPDAEFSRSVGFDARVDASYDIGPTSYTFVDVRNFGAPRLRTVLVESRDDIVLFSQTTNITRITYVNDNVYNDGPRYDVISRESAQPIPRLKLERRAGFDGASRGEELRPRVEGSSLRVVAIPFDSKPATAPRKVVARVDKAEVDRGWKNAGPPAEVTKLRARIKNEPAAVVDTPSKGKAEQTIAEPVATNPRLSPPATATEQTEPGNHSKKGGTKGSAAPRPPVETVPEARAKEHAPLNEKIVPPPIRPPTDAEAPRETIRPGKSDAPPRPQEPATRSIERKVPSLPEPRPQTKKQEPHEQAAPVTNQPQPPPHAKEKAKGKDEKKDEKKPE
jgi:hypothetical protein